MKEAVSQEQQEHNVVLWFKPKSQELISQYLKRFAKHNSTARELLESRAFAVFIRTNTAKDFVWKVYAKRQILSKARDMRLSGECPDGRWFPFTLTPEDACMEADILETIEWHERYQAFWAACEFLYPIEKEVFSHYCGGVSLTDISKTYNMPFARVYSLFRTALEKIITNLSGQGYDVITDTGAVLANIKSFSQANRKRARRKTIPAVR
jgi:hypothetical protein